MQRGLTLDVLMIDIGTRVNKQFAGRDLALKYREEEGRHFLGIFNVDIAAHLDHLFNHEIHSLEASHV